MAAMTAARIATASNWRRWVSRKSTTTASALMQRLQVQTRPLSTTDDDAAFCIDQFSDHCDLNLVYSPYPPIKDGPYQPLFEFVTQQWKDANKTDGYLDEKIAIRDLHTGMTHTFTEYYTRATHLAGMLKHGLQVDELTCAAIYCPNHVDYLPISLGVSLCGAKLTPVNPMYTKDEIETVLKKSNSRILMVHHTKLEEGLAAARACPKLEHVIVITDDDSTAEIPQGTVCLDDVLLEGQDKQLTKTQAEVHPKTDMHTLLLPYSSGTTGQPKGVCLTHENLVVNLLQMNEVEGLAFPPNHKLISPLPFFHIYAFTLSMLYCAWKGNELITSSGRFDLEQYCRAVQEHKPERTHLVPPICLGLAKHPMIDDFDLSSLKCIISAAAPLPQDVEQGVQQRLHVIVKQGWGMSELSPLGLLNTDYNNKPNSVGPLVPNTYGKIVDEKGRSLPPNQPGELMIKGPQVMMGYLDTPDRTAECLSQSGWLKTGDVARYDEDGYFFITDRLKELIKVRGYQVAPAELEALLLTNQNVADVAVIQVPDEESGEVPRAYVVLKPSEEAQKTTEEDIKEWVKERVAAYKRLEGGVVFTDEIPKSASGKILRRILRDQVKSAMA